MSRLVSRALCVIPLSAALFTTPATAAQIISLDFLGADPNGYLSVTGAFDWPAEGAKAAASIQFTGLDLIDATFTGNIEGMATWWDTGTGGVTGNEYFLAFDCDTASGCIAEHAPGFASGWLETPRGFDKPCTPLTVGNCSFHYEPLFASFEGYFRVQSDGPYSVRVAIGNPAVIPEPAIWATMILGFGLVGGMIRRKRDRPASGLALRA